MEQACNLDHNNVTVYLHALPTDQSALFTLAQQIETTVERAGFKINHPRKSRFHMTLARVNHSYPVDKVRALAANQYALRFCVCL